MSPSVLLLLTVFTLSACGREYYIDKDTWKARHADMCAFLTASIDGGAFTQGQVLCAQLNVHNDDWSQLAYAKMRQILSAKFRVDYLTVRERQGLLVPHADMFCIHNVVQEDPRKLLNC